MTDNPDSRKRSWWRLEASPPSQSLGCLLGLIGVVIGFAIGTVHDRVVIAQIRAANPAETIDFLPVLPVGWAIVGGFAGALCGGIIGTFLSRRK
jgi:uncharacterized membrane protein YjjB (DUF3815 family)